MLNLRKIIKTSPFIAIFGVASIINAPHLLASDFQSPRTAALGGAGHAGPLLNDSIYLNPSYAAFLNAYSISGNYSWANYQSGAYKYKIQNASIQDGRSELFQAGLAYTRRGDGNFIHLGTGKALIPKELGFGLGAKAYFPTGTTTQVIDGTFSTSLFMSETFQSSLIVDNLRESQQEISYGLYREFTVGTKFNFQKLLLVYIDPHYVPDLGVGKYGYEAGIELPLGSDIYLRGGMFRQSNIPTLDARGRGYGFGIGWIAPRMSLDYGVSRILEPLVGVAQVVGFTLFM
jgi:hypothetical protein